MAKKFFFVCAGFLCLVVAYHLGASSAQGQGALTVDGSHIDCDRGANGTVLYTGVVGRTFYWNGSAVPPPIPGSARAVATCGGYGFYVVVLENGDVYRGTDAQWTYDGNLVGAPTPAQGTTWGSVKMRYR
jgi:hypothetical protein